MCYEHNLTYRPYFSGWYWSCPALEISRPVYGNHGEIETRVIYSMIDSVAGCAFYLLILFDPERDRETALIISRSKDFGDSKLDIRLLDRGEVSAVNDHCLANCDSIGVTNFTYMYRISRMDTFVQVAISDDAGSSFRNVLAGSLRSDLRGLPQLLILSGNCWFVPAGSYADWDYVRFRKLD